MRTTESGAPSEGPGVTVVVDNEQPPIAKRVVGPARKA